MFDLTEKVALVTGAGSGIGESIARRYAEAGAFVYVADRDERSGKGVADQLGWGTKSAFLPVDVTDAAACDQAAAQVLNRHGRLDILVNNAGAGHVGTIQQTTAEDLDRLHAVNVRGVFNMSHAFIDAMIQQGGGVIVNMASVAGVTGLRDRLAYTTTKFAVVGLTKAMALDHATQGVRVNCICPGRVETPFVQARLKEYPDPEQAYQQMAAAQALGRMGQPDEIAALAVYLASDEAAFVTGSAMVIDGGLSAGK